MAHRGTWSYRREGTSRRLWMRGTLTQGGDNSADKPFALMSTIAERLVRRMPAAAQELLLALLEGFAGGVLHATHAGNLEGAVL
jgi:hypothetical protein